MTDKGTIEVYVGSVVSGSGGITQDTAQKVQFEGERLATLTEFGPGRDGIGITDTRGVTETLYRTDDGRLVAHVKDWSHWQGEPTTYSLHEVSEEDLDVGGRFEALGAEAGLGRALTLDEGLTPREEVEDY